MTGNIYLDLAISLAGVLALIGLARLIFGPGDPPFTAAAAAERLNFDEPDFAPSDWLTDEKQRAALARNSEGELALVIAIGDGLVTRRFPAGYAVILSDDGRLTLPRPDHTSKTVTFTLCAEEMRVWREYITTGGARRTN